MSRPCYSTNTEMASKAILVAAIDFGTTYSGWAFSFKHEYDTDPTKIGVRQWYGGQLESLKAPTTVLIKPDAKTFDSFGYEAENKYSELASDDSNEHKRWHYFRRFKMMLHGKMGLDRNIHLEDETQKSLPAKTVFSHVIRYLKEDILKSCTYRVWRGHIREDEITWVLTVPAIWTDAAKQFMREAAVEVALTNPYQFELLPIYLQLMNILVLWSYDTHSKRTFSLSVNNLYRIMSDCLVIV